MRPMIWCCRVSCRLPWSWFPVLHTKSMPGMVCQCLSVSESGEKKANHFQLEPFRCPLECNFASSKRQPVRKAFSENVPGKDANTHTHTQDIRVESKGSFPFSGVGLFFSLAFRHFPSPFGQIYVEPHLCNYSIDMIS